MPLTNPASFFRQINLYDFIRLKREECSIAYYHKSFLRGRSDLLDVRIDDCVYFFLICFVTFYLYLIGILCYSMQNITPRAQKGDKKLDLNMIGLNGDPDFYRMGAISPVPK